MQRDSGRVAVIVGLGLIGGSIALRLIAQNWTVFGFDPDHATQEAMAANGIDVLLSLNDISSLSPNVVIVAGPIWSIPELLKSLAQLKTLDCTVVEVGSVKSGVIAVLEHLDSDFIRRFVPVHPMAGKESSGFGNASETLLTNVPWALILDSGASIEHVLYVLTFLNQEFSARVHPLDTNGHDESVALISQLPHLLANALLAAVGESPRSRSAFALAAGSFRDGTRVAGSAPKRTAAMVFDNREALVTPATQVACEIIAAGMELRQNRNINLFERASRAREQFEVFTALHNQKSTIVIHREGLLKTLMGLGEDGSSVELVSVNGDDYEFVLSGGGELGE